MIALIDINNKLGKTVDIVNAHDKQGISLAPKPSQAIGVVKATRQAVSVASATEPQSIEVENTEETQCIEIGIQCLAKLELKAAINAKVPKALNVLPKMSEEAFSTEEHRSATMLYVDANGVPCFATAEQLKRLNTKTIFVKDLSDERIKSLSVGDIIMLEER